MKFSTALIPGLCVIASAFLLQSCGNCINGSGSTITVTRNTGPFSSVSFGTEGTIYISQGSTTSVTIMAQADVAGDMATEVNGGELNIYNRHCLRGNNPITVYVTTPDLNGVELSGSGDLYVTTSVSAPYFNAGLNGSGSITIEDSVVATTGSVSMSGSGNLNMILYCNSLNSNMSGSGSVTLSGSAGTHTHQLSGSGNLYAYNFITDTTNVTISGSGKDELFVNDLLNVSISGSGEVYYKGNAQVNSQISGSGKVLHIQ